MFMNCKQLGSEQETKSEENKIFWEKFKKNICEESKKQLNILTNEKI